MTTRRRLLGIGGRAGAVALAAGPFLAACSRPDAGSTSTRRTPARPAIDGNLPDLDGIDTILLGSPVWNTLAPMIMRTFLERAGGLPGTTIHPFLTYAVGEGSVVADYAELCPAARVERGLAIRGEEARDSADAVSAWIATVA